VTTYTCAQCRWHYALIESFEHVGMKNCLALPYPMCTEFFSAPAAQCTFPHLFQGHPAPCTPNPTNPSQDGSR
jgi:hypothetical protein